MTLKLNTRAGWPAELRFLLDKYPREVWPGHENLGEVARFWLDRHNGFREISGALLSATADFREGTLSPDQFRRFFAPRLQFFLQGLEGHHMVEDHHYFPVFRAAEARLLKGFDVLESDHAVLHENIVSVVKAANELLGKMEGDEDTRRTATDRYADKSDRLVQDMRRHLDDEEDLIVPVILEQGERKLFWG